MGRDVGQGMAPTAVTDDTDAATRLRVSVARISRRLQRATTDVPLTASEMAVLSTTARHGPLGLGRLAAEEAMNPTMLSRVVRTLEGAGLIAREEDPADRRAATVALTPEGRRLVDRVRTEKADALNRALDRLGAAERAVLTGALASLEALADALREEAR